LGTQAGVNHELNSGDVFDTLDEIEDLSIGVQGFKAGFGS
jgi:hypothetical protein